MDPVLQVRDLRVQYVSSGKPPAQVLRGVSFEISGGESVGILGESGCGKSTMALSVISLLPSSARVTGGSIVFRGRELLNLPERAMQQIRGAEISVVFQDPSSALNPVLRVGTQIADVIFAHRGWPRRRCRATAKALLPEVGFPDTGRIYEAFPHQLSGGQQQRVVIAQALACRPALLIADEPTSSLDSTLQAEILALLRRLRRELGISLLFISHNPAVLAEVTDRILVIYAGEIVEKGTTQRVLTAPLHPYTQALLRCLPGAARNNRRAQTRAVIEGIPPDPAEHLPGCPFQPRCAERMEVCVTRMPAEVEPFAGRCVRCFKYGG